MEKVLREKHERELLELEKQEQELEKRQKMELQVLQTLRNEFLSRQQMKRTVGEGGSGSGSLGLGGYGSNHSKRLWDQDSPEKLCTPPPVKEANVMNSSVKSPMNFKWTQNGNRSRRESSEPLEVCNSGSEKPKRLSRSTSALVLSPKSAGNNAEERKLKYATYRSVSVMMMENLNQLIKSSCRVK